MTESSNSEERVETVEMTPEQETRLREDLDAIQDRLTEIDALTSFLVGLKLGGSQRQRVAQIVKAAGNARAFLPERGKAIDVYAAQRATAFATVAIAETCALVLERALAARER